MAQNAAQRRGNPFARAGSPSPSPSNIGGRPKSTLLASPLSSIQTPGHSRHQSYTPLASTIISNRTSDSRTQSNSKTGTPTSNTFAPSFITTEDMRRGPEPVKGIEGENDFSGKRYVWLKDPVAAFVKGWILEELNNGQILVQCDDGSVSNSRLLAEGTRLTIFSNARSAPRASTKSIRQSSIKLTIWLN